MKIKKNNAAHIPAAAPGGSGAIMADRFKLDVPAAKPASSSSGPFTIVALVAAILAVAFLGGMVFFLNSSWGQMQLQ